MNSENFKILGIRRFDMLAFNRIVLLSFYFTANQSKRGRLKHWKITFYGSSMSPKEIQQRKR